tara:strand:- start:2488 stop:3231 length:744 start_codon:yes stop_codon:yes gene_type:complete
MSGTINGTTFQVELSTSPTHLCNANRKIHFNRTRVRIRRVIVCKFLVAAKHKSPEGFTFVPVFVSDDDRLLDPATCDQVGTIKNGEAEFNPTFVWKYENGQNRVRALEVILDPEDIDFDFEEEDCIDYPPPPVPSDATSPVARKMAAKKVPPFGVKRPRVETSTVEVDDDSDDLGSDDDLDSRGKPPEAPAISTSPDPGGDTDLDPDSDSDSDGEGKEEEGGEGKEEKPEEPGLLPPSNKRLKVESN